MSVKFETSSPFSLSYNGRGRHYNSGRNSVLDDQIDPFLLTRESLYFSQPSQASLDYNSSLTVKSLSPSAIAYYSGYDQSTTNNSRFSDYRLSLSTNTRPSFMASGPERSNQSPYHPEDVDDRSTYPNVHSGESQPSAQQPPSTSFEHSSIPGNAVAQQNFIVGYSPVVHSPGFMIAESHRGWYRDNQITSNSFRVIRWDNSEQPTSSIESIRPGALDENMRPPFAEAFCDLDSSIDPRIGRSGAMLPHHNQGPTAYRAQDQQGVRVDPGYISAAELSPHLFGSHKSKLEQLAMRSDHTLPPQPAENKITAKSTGKAKTARRNSRKDSMDRGLAHQRILHRHENLRTGLESIRDPAINIPGCHVLTPTMVDQSNNQVEFIGPVPHTRRLFKEKTRRKPMPEEERAAVRANRINGVCFRCKIYKEKCRGGFPCERCKGLPMWMPICVTLQFIEKRVFSRALYRTRATQQLANVAHWKKEPSRSAAISNGFQPVLNLWVHEYDPIDETVMDHILWRGDLKSNFKRFPSTPFGLMDDSSLTTDLDQYIDEHIPILLQELCRDKLDRIYIETMNTAYNYFRNNAPQDSLLLSALRIWAAQIVFFKKPWRFAQQSDSLGMGTITAEDSPLLAGINPLPRLLNQQLDSIVERRLEDLEQMFLSELQTRIFRRQPSEWFGLYLAIFVFLSSMERDTWTLETWNLEVVSNREGPHRLLAWPLNETPAYLADKNRHLVDVLVAHFRAVCKGVIPFTLDWEKGDTQEMAGNDGFAIRYMNTVGMDIKQRADTYLKEKAESKYQRDDLESLNMAFSCRLMIQTND